MGPLRLPSHGAIYLDASCFILGGLLAEDNQA